jgi:SAM-dependent methyltransferase
MVDKARLALGDDGTVLEGDLRELVLPRCDVVLLFDVIHLMTRPEQDLLLARIRDALAPGGLLIVREADADGGWGFRATRVVNGICRAVQGQWGRRFHFCTAAEWRRRLTDAGFAVDMDPMSAATFANVLFFARKDGPVRARDDAPGTALRRSPSRDS